jgi:hypothetical protein
MCISPSGSLPVKRMLFAIERLFVSVLYNVVEVIETVHIYGISTRIHSWPAESMDAAVIAEPVTRFACTELVKRKVLPTFYKCEMFVLDGVMQNAFLAAYRAVANGYLVDLGFGFDLEYDSAAVAASSIGLHEMFLCSSPRLRGLCYSPIC